MAIYQDVRRRVDVILQKKYAGLLEELIASTENIESETAENKVWFCWFQGIDVAPDIVKSCLVSQKKFLKGKKIVVVDLKNYSQYCEIPQDIVEKYKKGIIPAATFSDILRLELLIAHGGTWADATVLLTSDQYPREILSSDLFAFQYLDSRGRGNGISSWFLSSSKNNRFLIILREMMYQYWRDYDCLVEYFIFHLFFNMIGKRFPEVMAQMPKMNSARAIRLQNYLQLPAKPSVWERLTADIPIHKLTYRLSKDVLEDEGNVYHQILKMYR